MGGQLSEIRHFFISQDSDQGAPNCHSLEGGEEVEKMGLPQGTGQILQTLEGLVEARA